MPDDLSDLDRDAILLALDGVIAQVMTLRAIVSAVVPPPDPAKVAEAAAEEADGACKHPPDRREQTFGGTYCRDCGADLGASTAEAPNPDQ